MAVILQGTLDRQFNILIDLLGSYSDSIWPHLYQWVTSLNLDLEATFLPLLKAIGEP